MTAMTGFSRAHARAHGFDRLVMKASMTMLLWARRRADRASVAREEHTLLHAREAATRRREHESALRAARVI